MSQPMSEAFDKLAQLAGKLGVKNLADKVPPVWRHRVDEQWEIALNGDEVEMRIDTRPEPMRMGATIPAFHAAVWYNGWLAALISPIDGTFVVGTGANEDTFIDALDTALSKFDEVKDDATDK